jgi:hypothetical protein
MLSDDIAHHRKALPTFRGNTEGGMEGAQRAIVAGGLSANLTVGYAITKANIHERRSLKLALNILNL